MTEPTKYSASVYRRQSFDFKFRREDENGDPLSWAGIDVVALIRAGNAPTSELLVDFINTGSTSAPDVDQYRTLSLSSAETASLEPGTYNWEVWIVDTNVTPNIETPYVKGTFTVRESLRS